MNKKMLTVRVELMQTSQPLIYTNVINTYQKGSMFVIYTAGELSHKHPIASIFRVTEDYGYHSRVENIDKVGHKNDS